MNTISTGVDSVCCSKKKGNLGKKYLNDTWDVIHGVALYGHFVCSLFASRMMASNKYILRFGATKS